MWTVFRRHPWAAETLSMTRPQILPNLMGYSEWALGALRDAGFGANDMMYAHLTLFGHVRVIDMAAGDPKEPLLALVGFEDGKHLVTDLFQQRQGIVVALLGRKRQHLLLRQLPALTHPSQQVGFVLEMPVKRAARHPRLARDRFEGRRGYALLREKRLGGIQDRSTRLLGILLRSSQGFAP